MQYEELHRRYGTHVSQRIRRELTSAEFDRIPLDDLSLWLEQRADRAHEAYHQVMVAPEGEQDASRRQVEEACQRWREAEDLSYLVTIAEDVSTHARAAAR